MNTRLAAVLTTCCCVCAAFAQGAARFVPPSAEQVAITMKKATDFLLKDQNPDGSWGSPRNPESEFWSNPETHRSWIVATTGLACMALQEIEQTPEIQAAYDRGIDYILGNALVKRPSDWDIDNTWAYVYGLQALARAAMNPRYADTPRLVKIREVAPQVIERLRKYQTPSGGWGYYDSFQDVTMPGTWATSFMTASAVLALVDARSAGFAVDPKILDPAVRAVRRCRLPTGAYTYSVEAIPSPGGLEWIDQIKGSLSRIQVGNLALRLAGKPDEVSDDDLRKGLEHFFKEHRFLDIARKKPIPHEAYYLNSGYFYFYGHWYAAQVIETLPAAERPALWEKLQHHIVKTQEDDGSMWDYYMNSYGKPYGTSYSLMALNRSIIKAR